jgi:hypothetical protein
MPRPWSTRWSPKAGSTPKPSLVSGPQTLSETTSPFTPTIAPDDSGLKDYTGGFVVTTGTKVEDLASAFEADNDHYRAIMVKALADRFAEACAEHMHHLVRTELSGYPRAPITPKGAPSSNCSRQLTASASR